MRERPSLHALEMFLAIVEQGTMSAAAQALGISQPSISAQVKSLEGYFGAVLLERRGRQTQPTAIGLEVAATARHLLSLVEGLDQKVADHKGLALGTLTVGASATATESWFPHVLGRFERQHADLKVALEVGNSTEMLQALRSGAFGVVVVGRIERHPDYVATPVFEDTLRLFTAPDHPVARCLPDGLPALGTERFILREAGSATRAHALQCLEAGGCRPVRELMLRTNEAVKRAVSEGLGIGILSAETLKLELDAGMIVILEVPSWDCRRHFWLVRHRHRPLSFPEQAFVEHMTQSFIEQTTV